LPGPALDSYLRNAKFIKLTRLTACDPKVLRARLNEVRTQGWSCVRGEIEESITGVAVPLIHPNGQTIAAVQVHLASERATPQVVKKTIVPELQRAAQTISKML